MPFVKFLEVFLSFCWFWKLFEKTKKKLNWDVLFGASIQLIGKVLDVV